MDAFNTPIFIIIASPSLATYFQLTMTLVFNSKNNPLQEQVKQRQQPLTSIQDRVVNRAGLFGSGSGRARA